VVSLRVRLKSQFSACFVQALQAVFEGLDANVVPARSEDARDFCKCLPLVFPIHEIDDDSLANDEIEGLILEVERSDVSVGHVAICNASALSELNHRLAEVTSGQL
jgi:hypothetical protein